MSCLHSRGSPIKGEENQKRLLHPYLLTGPKEDEIATKPLRSRGSPIKGDKIRIGCLTPALSGPQNCVGLLRNSAFSGAPNTKRGNKIRTGFLAPAFSGPKRWRSCYVTPAFSGAPNAKRGEKIRTGYLTVAFSGAHKWAKLRRHRCILLPSSSFSSRSEVATSALLPALGVGNP